MLHQERFIRVAVQTHAAGVDSRFSQEAIESPREEMLHTSTPPNAFDHPFFQKMLDSWLQNLEYSLFAVNDVNDQEVFRAKRRHSLVTDLFQKAQEFRVLDLAVQGEPD